MKHYYRVKRGGTVDVPKRDVNKNKPYSIENCIKVQASNTFCSMHNRRFKRHGDPNYINPKCNRDGGYKERHKLYQKQWRIDNWDYYKAYLSASKKRIKQATPSWVDIKELIKIYQERPENHHVDHIIPIKGKNVSGLNVPWNLQYLTIEQNLKKSNKEFFILESTKVTK